MNVDGNAPETLGAVFARLARTFPEKPALRTPDGQGVTFYWLITRINALNAAMRARGLCPGDRVAILAKNSIAYVEIFGLTKSGFVVVPLNWRLSEGALVDLLRASRPKTIFADDTFLDTARSLVETLGAGIEVISLSRSHPNAVPYTSLIQSIDVGEPEHIAHPDDPLCILFTSGTTGQPKGVVHTHRSILNNLHVSSDVIIDASMPALIRAGGKGWGPDGKEADANCVIPDNSYAPVYDETIKFFKDNGKMNPATAGTVQNIGLMAQKAEEYGSHPTTFEIPEDGTVRVMDGDTVLMSHEVEAGDIWRMASARRAPIENWIQLALDRMATTGYETIFWLDRNRAHDAELLKYVEPALAKAGVAGKVKIMAPRDATIRSFEVIYKGDNTIAVTGTVLRDYLTDLFPILEVGTSAKMLSVVGLMNGGGLFETGAGGSAPKHVQQLQEENYLRWDSLGEFCALGASLEHLANAKDNAKAQVLADALDTAIEGLLDNDKSPARRVGGLDNRGSHFYIALYWAQALAAQDKDAELKAHFTPIADALSANEDKIVGELNGVQGAAADTGGYYHAPQAKVDAVMRPSATLNGIIG